VPPAPTPSTAPAEDGQLPGRIPVQAAVQYTRPFHRRLSLCQTNRRERARAQAVAFLQQLKAYNGGNASTQEVAGDSRRRGERTPPPPRHPRKRYSREMSSRNGERFTTTPGMAGMAETYPGREGQPRNGFTNAWKGYGALLTVRECERCRVARRKTFRCVCCLEPISGGEA